MVVAQKQIIEMGMGPNSSFGSSTNWYICPVVVLFSAVVGFGGRLLAVSGAAAKELHEPVAFVVGIVGGSLVKLGFYGDASKGLYGFEYGHGQAPTGSCWAWG